MGLAVAGGGVAVGGNEPDAEDGGAEEDALAFCCSFASLFKRIYGDNKVECLIDVQILEVHTRSASS